MKVRELLIEKMNNWIGRYSKGIDKFILWQDNHYYYSLQKSAQSPGGKFEIVKNFNDMSLEEVKDWLSGAGYKEEKNVNESNINWAKEKALANRERIKKEREDIKKLQMIKNREKAKELNRNKLLKIGSIIIDAVSQVIPDGDPIDLIHKKLLHLGFVGEFDDLIPLLNKAVKETSSLAPHKTYDNYLRDMWDTYLEQDPDWNNGKNPWK